MMYASANEAVTSSHPINPWRLTLPQPQKLIYDYLPSQNRWSMTKLPLSNKLKNRYKTFHTKMETLISPLYLRRSDDVTAITQNKIGHTDLTPTSSSILINKEPAPICYRRAKKTWLVSKLYQSTKYLYWRNYRVLFMHWIKKTFQAIHLFFNSIINLSKKL